MLAYLLTYMIVMIDMVEDYGFTQARTLTDTSAACRLRLSLLIMACELLQQIVRSMSSHSSDSQKTSRISRYDGRVKLSNTIIREQKDLQKDRQNTAHVGSRGYDLDC